jgi:hypothetical protein
VILFPENPECTELDWGSESRQLSDRGNAPRCLLSLSLSLSPPKALSLSQGLLYPKSGSTPAFLLVDSPLRSALAGSAQGLFTLLFPQDP